MENPLFKAIGEFDPKDGINFDEGMLITFFLAFVVAAGAAFGSLVADRDTHY